MVRRSCRIYGLAGSSLTAAKGSRIDWLHGQLVVDAFYKIARRYVFETIRIRLNQYVGKVIRKGSMTIQLAIADNGLIELIILESLALPVFLVPAGSL
jgi:hypothetical protein